jgi:hypothetical protein
MRAPAIPIDARGEMLRLLGSDEISGVRLGLIDSHPPVPEGETVFMELIESGGQSLLFSNTGFTLPGHGFIPYSVVESADRPRGPYPFNSPQKRDDEGAVEFLFRDLPAVTVSISKDVRGVLGMFIQVMRRKYAA